MTGPPWVRPGGLRPPFRIPSEPAAAGVLEVAVGVTDLWRSPTVGPELDTQLLLGEPVLVVGEQGAFSQVEALWQPSSRAARGQPGWVRTDHLAAPATRGPDSVTVGVAARGVTAVVASSRRRIELSYGTALRLADRSRPAGDGQLTVALPGGRRAQVPAASVRRHGGTYDPTALVDAARTFLGLDYRWGGLSSWGTDCSGLVHLTHRLHGWVVPRDAVDQHAVCDAVEDAHPGDLYFFRRDGSPVHHVGYVTQGGLLLHAPGSGAGVEEVALSADRAATSLGTWRPRQTAVGRGG